MKGTRTMAALGRILLATDLEPKSDRAMERAVQLARQFGAELTALHIVQGEDGAYAHLPLHHIEAEMQRLLLAVPGGAGLPVRAVAVRGGAVGPEVAGYAGQWRPDLVVVGGHARNRVTGLFLPATVERIAVADDTPVLAVWDKPQGPYARALVPVDFSPRSRATVAAARHLLPEGTLHLLHVLDLPSTARPTGDEAAVQRAFAEEFATLLDGIPGDGVRCEVCIGTPAVEIVRAARLERHDLVVMGSARRNGVMRAVLGSVAQAVLTELSCDALLAGDTGPVP